MTCQKTGSVKTGFNSVIITLKRFENKLEPKYRVPPRFVHQEACFQYN